MTDDKAWRVIISRLDSMDGEIKNMRRHSDESEQRLINRIDDLRSDFGNFKDDVGKRETAMREQYSPDIAQLKTRVKLLAASISVVVSTVVAGFVEVIKELIFKG